MIDGSLLLHAFARGKKGNERVRVLELGAIGRRHYSHRLRLPHGPIGLFSSLPSSFLLTSIPLSIPTLSLLFTSPFNPFAVSRSLSLSFFPVYFPVTFFSLTLSYLFARFVFSVLFYTSFSPPVLTFKREIWRLYRTSLGRVFYLARPSITSYAIRMKKNNCYIRCSPGGCVNTFYSWRAIAAAWFNDLLFSSRHTRREWRRPAAPMGKYVILLPVRNRFVKVKKTLSIYICPSTKQKLYKEPINK